MAGSASHRALGYTFPEHLRCSRHCRWPGGEEAQSLLSGLSQSDGGDSGPHSLERALTVLPIAIIQSTKGPWGAESGQVQSALEGQVGGGFLEEVGSNCTWKGRQEFALRNAYHREKTQQRLELLVWGTLRI